VQAEFVIDRRIAAQACCCLMTLPFQNSPRNPPGRSNAATRSIRVSGSVQCQACALTTPSYASSAAKDSKVATSTRTRGSPAVRRARTAAISGSGSMQVTFKPADTRPDVALPVPAPTSSTDDPASRPAMWANSASG